MRNKKVTRQVTPNMNVTVHENGDIDICQMEEMICLSLEEFLQIGEHIDYINVVINGDEE